MDNNSKTLAEMFPDLAKQWDYGKNEGITPNTVSAGSHKEVYWICPICHQSYKKRICNRTSPSKRANESAKCPICLGRVIIPGFNSLKAKFNEIVEKEWDFDKNEVDPDTISPYTNKKYWWRCLKGHDSYLASCNNKMLQNGGNCPKCSHHKISVENSLLFVNPILAEEWNYELNELEPDEVFANSNISVYWKCKKGHVWKAKINNRNNKRGCPICSRGRQTSLPEQIIYHYVKLAFPDAINGYKYKNAEIDIFIPSLLWGIEYDGGFYHNTINKVAVDFKKTKKLFDGGIKLIRIREKDCPKLDDGSVVIEAMYSSDYSYLNSVISQILSILGKVANKTIAERVDVENVRNIIEEKLSTVPQEKSLLKSNPKLAEDWDYELNAPLRPENVYPNSSKTAHWKCKRCGYQWTAVIGSRNQGYGCPRCSNREHYTTEEWVKKAKMIHGNKYDYSEVNYINSKTPVKIKCLIHGFFEQIPSEHLQGKGCKFCTHQAFHPKESLAIIAPSIAVEWDYELNENSGYTPETIGIDSNKKFYWHCDNGKPHSYLATIASRVYRHSRCSICHGKQVTYDTSVECNCPELVKEWCDFNEITPSEVSCGSERKFWWKCENPMHKPYLASVYSRVHLHSGCPECAGNRKSDVTYRQELAKCFPNIKLLTPYVKSNVKIQCECNQCGYRWESYPYNLLKKRTGCPNCKYPRIQKK